MNLWAIVPVKSLHRTKSRLKHILTPAERAQLTKVMFVRTVELLQTISTIRQIVVVSRDPIVAKMAAAAQCHVLAEPAGSGLNGAVTVGATFAADNGATHLLMLPTDLPFLNRLELNSLVEEVKTAPTSPTGKSRTRGQAVSPNTLFICSDQKQQGTNALVLPAGNGFRFYYGRSSFHLHQQEAARLSMHCQIMPLPSFQFDLDNEQDYDFYTKNLPLILS